MGLLSTRVKALFLRRLKDYDGSLVKLFQSPQVKYFTFSSMMLLHKNCLKKLKGIYEGEEGGERGEKRGEKNPFSLAVLKSMVDIYYICNEKEKRGERKEYERKINEM